MLSPGTVRSKRRLRARPSVPQCNSRRATSTGPTPQKLSIVHEISYHDVRAAPSPQLPAKVYEVGYSVRCIAFAPHGRYFRSCNDRVLQRTIVIHCLLELKLLLYIISYLWYLASRLFLSSFVPAFVHCIVVVWKGGQQQ
jgi:hypothetical protein